MMNQHDELNDPNDPPSFTHKLELGVCTSTGILSCEEATDLAL